MKEGLGYKCVAAFDLEKDKRAVCGGCDEPIPDIVLENLAPPADQTIVHNSKTCEIVSLVERIGNIFNKMHDSNG